MAVIRSRSRAVVRVRGGLPALLVAAALGGVLTSAAGSAAAAAARPTASSADTTPSWVAAWAMPTDAWNANYADHHPHLDGQTVRMAMRLGFGGSQVRLRFSNAQGAAPLVLSDVHVAAGDARGDPEGAGIPVTFGGATSVTVPVGATVQSDPAPLTTTVLHDAVVSFYVPQPASSVTGDTTDAYATTRIATGDRAGDPTQAGFGVPFGGGLLLTGVDVYAPNDGLVVAFGDSITAGWNIPQELAGLEGLQNPEGWPYWLANRLAAWAASGGPKLSLIDMAISSNRVTLDTTAVGALPVTGGLSALSRFRTDVLDQTGLRTVLMMEGINDIGGGVAAGPLESAYTTLAGEVHAAGGRLLLSPLTPSGDRLHPVIYGSDYWSAAGEAERAAVNAWIESSSLFNPGFDFAPVLADPGNPNALAPRFDSGDHLHPNLAGYQAMANSISLPLLMPPAVSGSRPARPGRNRGRPRSGRRAGSRPRRRRPHPSRPGRRR